MVLNFLVDRFFSRAEGSGAIEENVQDASVVPAGHFRFKGYDIPLDLMMMTGGGPETFEEISNHHQRNLKKWAGLTPNHAVLEIGCGIGRDAIPLSEYLTTGSYTGVDIIWRSIAWCQDNIGAKNENFHFIHYDVEDQLHNADGATKTTDIVLPLADGSIDRIFLYSVFTHLYRADIEHYIREFRRVLNDDGLVYASTFIYDEDILTSSRNTNRTIFDLRFDHEIEQGCRINKPDRPLAAVAFTKEAWLEMLEANGMRLTNRLFGQWSSFHPDPDDGQDVIIFGKASSALICATEAD
ncbi:class I SAM-dependent methyltransferase [Aliirhizobium terrae]|uniref:class I SAM-dependent methyltransferase n=1 Tax=Terrirhizobium terrae TaxID=2926709 RepID=UPI0025759107|nr:class I SAM-dependent methyltransferase [Rhizobium sp. CC-CFT758]WJH39062.1 class I SAM-dependent methyltransferase [Rhizobium sp. CC-CFT758]